MRADLVEETKGYLGLTLPAAVRAFTMATAQVCSIKPSMGRLANGSSSGRGGSL